MPRQLSCVGMMTTDAGMDAGPMDAGLAAATPDAGPTDAGTDAGATDAGPTDAGIGAPTGTGTQDVTPTPPSPEVSAEAPTAPRAQASPRLQQPLG